MPVTANCWRVEDASDLHEDLDTDLSAQNTFIPPVFIGASSASRRFWWIVTGTWSGTLTIQRSTAGTGGPWTDVLSITANDFNELFNDGLTGDTWYRMGFKTGNYTSGTATCTFRRAYTQLKAYTNRITAITDPMAERGTVVKITRSPGDPIVNSSKRTELAHQLFVGEANIGSGGGWHWLSYMLGTEWPDAVTAGDLTDVTGPGTSNSVLIQQWHVHGTDAGVGFTHPPWSIRVSDKGVTLKRWNMNDDDNVNPKIHAYWPIDTLVWHDVVWGFRWDTDVAGRAIIFLDGKLIWDEQGCQCYPGMVDGLWESEGVYKPGAEMTVASLTTYAKGMKQGMPTMALSECAFTPELSGGYPIHFLRSPSTRARVEKCRKGPSSDRQLQTLDRTL